MNTTTHLKPLLSDVSYYLPFSHQWQVGIDRKPESEDELRDALLAKADSVAEFAASQRSAAMTMRASKKKTSILRTAEVSEQQEARLRRLVEREGLYAYVCQEIEGKTWGIKVTY